MCSFAAAFLRRCRAQSMLLSTSWIVLESSRWMCRSLKRARYPSYFVFEKSGNVSEKCLSSSQYSFSARAGGALAVRVRQGVAVRHGRVAELAPFRFVDPGRVADPVEGTRSRQLLVDECDDVAPDGEALVAVPHVPVDVVDDLRRDEGDDLPEYRVLRLRSDRLRNPGRRSATPALRMRFLRVTLLRFEEFGTICYEDLLSWLDFRATQLYTTEDPFHMLIPSLERPQGRSGDVSKNQTWDGSDHKMWRMRSNDRIRHTLSPSFRILEL